MVAVAAAGIAAAGSVAAAGVSASGGKGGGGAPTMKGMSPWERLFNRGTADMDDEARHVMEDSLAQANWMQPELYHLLGYEPVYDDRISPENLKSLGDAVDQLALKQQEGKVTVQQNKIDIQTMRKQLKGLKGPKHKAERQALKQQIHSLHIETKTATQADGPLQKEAAAAQKALSDAQTMPRRVIGVKPLASGPQDPTGSKDGLYKVAFDLQNEALANALQGKQPIDATLKTQWDQKEATLRERLRRQLGDDYETSTAGSLAMSQFDHERNDSFSSYNTNIVAQLSQETQARAESLSNLTSARLQQLLYPANAQADRAKGLADVAGARLGIGALFQNERTAQYTGNSNAYAQNQAASRQNAAQLAGAINQGANAVAAAGPALAKYLGSSSTDTTYDNSATDPRNIAGM